MSSFWSLVTLFGLGAFHGINPAMGWLFAVALGLQEQKRAAVLRALPPIALGHALQRSFACHDRPALASIAAAIAAGHFKSQILPIELKSKKGPVLFDTDEHVRADASLEGMAKLGRGAVAYLGHNDRAEQVMDEFLERISHPALTEVKIDWGDLQVSEVHPHRIPDLFFGRPVTLAGRFEGKGPKTIRIKRQDLEAILQPARGNEAVAKERDRPLFTPPTPEEIARRKALVAEILQLRKQAVVTPLTSADLVQKAREQEYEAYGKPR